MRYPFCAFANNNLGVQFHYADFTGNFLRSTGVGQFPVLPQVNIASGNLFLKSNLVTAQESAGKFEFGFVYNSQNTIPWSYAISEITAQVEKVKITLREKDGAFVDYVWSESEQAYISPAGAASYFYIQKINDQFVKTNFKTGEKTLFDLQGKIIAEYDARGFSIHYAYTGNELSSITSDAGTYTIHKTALKTEMSFIEKDSEVSELLGTWNFDSLNRLQSAVIPNPNNYTLSYAYEGDTNNVIAVTQTDGTALHFTYQNNQLSHLQQGSHGPSYQFNYAGNTRTITDAVQNVITATVDAQSRILNWEQNAEMTVFNYDAASGDLTTVVKPDGASIKRSFNAKGLITEEVHPNGQTTQFDYDDFDPETYALLIKRELILDNADPAQKKFAVTRYVYDTKIEKGMSFRQLRFVISPLGSVTEYRYDDNNQLASKRCYLKKQYLVSSLLPTNAIDSDAMAKWIAGLSVAEKSAITLKTFSHNNRGQCLSEQDFSTISDNAEGIDTDDASNNHFEYTAQGKITAHDEKLDAQNTAITAQQFDGLSRLIQHQNALNESRSFFYADTDKKRIVTEANLRTQTTHWNDAGQITSIATSIQHNDAVRIKTKNYDAAGRLNAITEIDGQTTYQLFDAQNRLRFTISPTGRVTEIQYDDKNHYQCMTKYYNTVPIALITSPDDLSMAWLEDHLETNVECDVSTYQVFDASSRLQFSIDGRGAIKEYRYDLRNQKIATIAYADPITADEINALKTGAFTSASRTALASKAIIERTSYDLDGNIIATQDGDGYVIVHQYNPAGFEIYRRAFAAPVAVDLSNDLIIPGNTADDYAQYFYSDAKGQTRLTVDDVAGANYVRQQRYYPTGKTASTRQYANTAASAPTASANPASLIPAENTEDRITTCEYDALKRLSKKHLPDMRLETCAYDNMNHCVLESMGDDLDCEIPAGAESKTQITAKQFDDWGQLSAVAMPLVYAKIASIQADTTLSDAVKAQKIKAVWDTQAERYQYDDLTGLHTAKFDVVPDDVDATNPVNQAKTVFYYDADKRLALTVGPLGEAATTTHDPICDKPLEYLRYATAIEATALPGLTGGLMTDAVKALLKSSVDDVCDAYLYDGCGDEIKHQDPDGFETDTHFNSFGDWDEKIIPIDSTTPSLKITRQFNLRRAWIEEKKTAQKEAGDHSITRKRSHQNLHGHVTSETDGNNATTTMAFEPRGLVKSTTDALSRTTTVVHDAFERKTKETLAGHQSIVTEYTQAERRLTKTRVDAAKNTLSTTSLLLDAHRNPTQKTDALGNITKTLFNEANQESVIRDALGNETINTHDLRGLLRAVAIKNANDSAETTTTLDYTLSRQLQSKIKDATTLALKTRHTINALSQRAETLKPSARKQKFVHNKRGLATEHHLVLDEEKNISVATLQNYNAQKQASCMTAKTTDAVDQYQKNTGFDAFGRSAVEMTDPAVLALTRKKVFDQVNRVVATIDAKKQIHYAVHDAIGNILFEINPNGGVTEHRYDQDTNTLVFTAQYNIAIDVSLFNDKLKGDVLDFVMTEADIRGQLQPSALDRKTAYFYDAANNERFRVSGAGALTESRYNANNEKIASLQYADFISPVDLNFETLTTANLIQKTVNLRNLKKDKAEFRIVDALGQARFIIDSDGSVVEKRYEGLPHLVTTEIKYAALLAVDTIESIAIKKSDEVSIQISALSSVNDRTTRWIHDGLGRIQYHVKPNGAVTKFDYEGDTKNPSQITTFSNPISLMAVPDYQTLKTCLDALVADPEKDAIETREYDGANREVKRTNALGLSESWTYDGASRKATHTTTSGQTWRYEYDGASRLAFEYSPETTVYSSSISGNQIKVTTTVQSVKKTVHYDENSNTTEIISAEGASDEHQVTFAYNALDQKIQDCWPSLQIDDPTKNADFLVRPEQAFSASKNVVTGVHGHKLVAIDEANNPEFYCHNAAGQLVYRVNALGYVIEYSYDALGQAIAFTAYANPLTFDLSTYVNTGLTADLVFQDQIENQLKDPKKDNTIFQDYDARGRICKVTRQEVVCYVPNADTSKPANIATFSPVTQHTYNAFGEVVKESKLIDSSDGVDITRDELKWFDLNGHEIATVNANGAAKIFTLDSEGRKIEEYAYANNIAAADLSTLAGKSFVELQAILAPLVDLSKDHHILTPRDVLGRITAVNHVGIVVQQQVAGKIDFEDMPEKVLGVTYTYAADNQIKTVTYPNGGNEIYYYDERGNLAAKALPARTQKESNGSDGAKIRPIIYYHVNAHGKRVEVFQPASGCAVDLDPASNSIPQPLSTSDKDRYARFVYDAKNHITFHQDENNTLKQMTYNKTGQVARKYHPTTVADPKAANQEKIHLDETRSSYDALKRLTETAVYRDSAIQDKHAYLHDAFAVIGEGPGDGTYPVQHSYDLAARKWKTHNENGGVQLMGHNAAGEETVKITSQVQDLSQKNYEALAPLMAERDALVSADAKVHFVETIRDPIGRTVAFVEPRYLDENKAIVAPKHQITFSNFDEKTSVTTPNNETTDLLHNKIKKMVRQIDPAIAVTDEAGNTVVARPVTTMGYSDLMGKIGERDANGHAQLWARDEANQETAHTLADGTTTFQKRDIFSNGIEFTSAAGNTWKKVFDGKNKVIQVTMPSGDVWSYVTNENGFVYKIIPPVGSVTGTMLYAQGPYGDMSAEYLPMGEAHLYTHDRHHSVLLHTAMNIDGSTAYTYLTARDFWGKVTDIVDGSRSTFKNSYFLDGLLKQELQLTMGNTAQQMLAFDSVKNNFSTTPVATPLKNVSYEYLTPLRLAKIIDANTVNPQTLVQLFNINRDPVRVTETNASGGVLRDSIMTYNAMRAPLTHRDNNFSADYLYDLVLNRRNIKAICDGLVHDGWWTYDSVDRALVDDGQLINGVIQPVFVPGSTWGHLSPNQGNRYTHQQRLRATQALYFEDAAGEIAELNPLSAALSYNKNEVVSTIKTVPHTDAQPQTDAVIASADVVRMDKNIDDIGFISPFERFKAGPPFAFIQLFSHLLDGQTVENTTLFAVGCSLVLPSKNCIINAGNNNPLFIYGIPYMSHPRSTYAYLASTEINGKTYQGASVFLVQGETLFYTTNIAYKPDGNVSAVIIPITDKNQYYPFLNAMNANGYLIKSLSYPTQSFPVKDHVNISSTFSEFNVDGLPGNNIVFFYNFLGSTTITLNNVFQAFDRLVILKTIAQITNQYGTNVITSARLYDPSYRLNAITNAKNAYDSTDQAPHIFYFLRSTANGNLLVEYMDNTTKPSMRFIPDCKGNIVSTYGTVVNAAGDTKLALQLTASPVTSFNILQMMNLPSTVVQQGDNWRTISSRIFGSDYSSFLSTTGVQLIPGQVINMRQILTANNKASDFTPYERLMAAIYNGINPALKAPQPPPPKPHHHSFWREFIEGVVAVVILACIPTLIGPAMFGLAAGTAMSALQLGISTALAGVLASAAQQGLAIAFGDQQGFSVVEMLDYGATAGITAGLGQKLGIGNLLDKNNFVKYSEAFAAEATVNATVQCFEMSIGLRRQFDLKLLLEQSVSTLLSAKIGKGASYLNKDFGHAADVLANAATGKAFGYQQNAADLAANFVGDEAEDAENDVLSKQKIKPQTSTSVDPQEGASAAKSTMPNPANFTDGALQTESRFIADAMQGDGGVSENPIAPFYEAYQDTLTNSLDALNAASLFSLQNRAQRVAAQPVQQQNRSGFVGRVAEKVYENQDAWWARGIMGFATALSSPSADSFVHALNYDAVIAESMNPVSAMANTAAGYDPITGRRVSIKQGYEDFAMATVGMFGGEVAGVAFGAAMGFAYDSAPGVARNVAAMFGDSEVHALSPMRLRVMQNITDMRASINASFFDIHLIVEEILAFDVRTEPNEAVFWSGPGNRELAENYAIATNKFTLGMKPDGQYLESLDLFSKFTYSKAAIPWIRLSESFAKGASGDVFAFVEGAGSESIFTKFEKPILLSNKNVKSITYSPVCDSSCILN